MTSVTRIMQGNEACAEGALAAGCGFFAGYPITPASEIAEVMARELPRRGGVFMQMEDELASISAVIGACWGGARVCTASSGPGMSLMQEGIGFAAVTETPCVIISVMRGGPATGQPTLPSQGDVMQARFGSHGDYEIIALVPANAQEAFDLTSRAFTLAETYRVPVIVLLDEIVGHTREKVRMDPNMAPEMRTEPPRDRYQPYLAGADGLLQGMPSFNRGYRLLVDGQLHDETGNRAGHDPDTSADLVWRLNRKITDHVDDIADVQELFLEDAEVVVVCYGTPSRSAWEAVDLARKRGVRAGIFRLRTLFPFPAQRLQEATRGSHTLVVPEMNVGKVLMYVQGAAGGAKVISLPKLGGLMHTPEEILAAITLASEGKGDER